MRLLRVLLRFVDVLGRRQVLVAELLADPLANLLHRVGAHARGVGTHVGNQADRALRAQLNALIQPLRHTHRPADVETQPPRGLLLQLAGGEWRARILAALLLFDGPHAPLGPLQLRHYLVDGRLVRQRVGQKLLLAIGVGAIRDPDRLPGYAHHPCGELSPTLPRRKQRIYIPVLHRLEGVDLAFALHNQPQRHSLHASGAQAALYLVP